MACLNGVNFYQSDPGEDKPRRISELDGSGLVHHGWFSFRHHMQGNKKLVETSATLLEQVPY